jgi:hypothetical protein
MRWFQGFLVAIFGLTCIAQVKQKVEEKEPSTNPQRTVQQSTAPSAQQPPVASPSKLREEEKLRTAPQFVLEGPEVKRSVERFVAWAGATHMEEAETVRKSIAGVKENRQIATALCDHAFESVKVDHGRTLVSLALLGEMRHPAGHECLARFVHLPFPEKGTVVDGEIIEQTNLAMLQAKAVDGLAYLHDPKADEEVLWAASKHPSRVVRAEAIDAYLWNHGDSAQAREQLARVVRPDERIFLERIRRVQGENAESFNRKLDGYLKSHPDRLPPKPEKQAQKVVKRPETVNRTAQDRLAQDRAVQPVKPTEPPAQ